MTRVTSGLGKGFIYFLVVAFVLSCNKSFTDESTIDDNDPLGDDINSEYCFDASRTPLNATKRLTSCEYVQIDQSKIFVASGGTMRLETQSQVNSFGANQYEKIVGNLFIISSPNTSITDLSPLNSIKVIDGALAINQSSQLVSLTGLENLQCISGAFNIGYNLSLKNLVGLSSLNNSGNINIEANGELESLNGLTKYNYVAGSVTIRDNNRLANIDGLIGLECAESIFVARNHLIENIDALNSLVSCRQIIIDDNDGLLNVAGLSNVRSYDVFWYVRIQNNLILDNLCGITELAKSITTVRIGNQDYPAYQVNDNAFNPTQNEVVNGLCSD